MASNNSNNTVKHKVNGYSITFSKTINKWVVKDGNKTLMNGNFKECRKYCNRKLPPNKFKMRWNPIIGKHEPIYIIKGAQDIDILAKLGRKADELDKRITALEKTTKKSKN